MEFAMQILKGVKPTEALRSSFEVLDLAVADKMDERTLQEHIKKFFGMSRAPRTNEEWKQRLVPLLRAWLLAPFPKEFRENSS
jgi:hypothetical protein